ncbi:MAG: AzlD domain-containing protein [Clostridiaceae bacterium]|jgi:branched-subunit amino acid transport protein|nr:AzlD domain-containing protein [Clostridiaceae bacterium]
MEQQAILIILGMSIVTYIPRALPIIVLSKFKLPDWFLRWLKYIPVAILSALLVPEVVIFEDSVNFSLDNKNLLAAIPSLLVAYKTKNLFVTVSVGIMSMLILNLLLPNY